MSTLAEQVSQLEARLLVAESLLAKMQYYYRNPRCTAMESESAACVCWYNHGTGPFKGEEDKVKTWRRKP